MNDQRRSRITIVLDQLEILRDEIADIADEEQEAFENIPESLIDTKPYETSEAACDSLIEADEHFDDLIAALEAARDGG